ncbi:MAG: hypothetical protein ACKPKO_55385, partial [Candidatus Fonsibacter sp.]
MVSIFIRSDVIGFGRTAFMTASSESISMYAPLRAENGLRVLSGITYCYYTDPLNPTVFNQTASISPNGGISTLGGIYCEGNLTAPNIYTMTQVDAALAPTAT